MALTDVIFSGGEVQDFLVEIPTAVYSGSLEDVLVEESGSQTLMSEIPEASGGNIFIMSE